MDDTDDQAWLGPEGPVSLALGRAEWMDGYACHVERSPVVASQDAMSECSSHREPRCDEPLRNPATSSSCPRRQSRRSGGCVRPDGQGPCSGACTRARRRKSRAAGARADASRRGSCRAWRVGHVSSQGGGEKGDEGRSHPRLRRSAVITDVGERGSNVAKRAHALAGGIQGRHACRSSVVGMTDAGEDPSIAERTHGGRRATCKAETRRRWRVSNGRSAGAAFWNASSKYERGWPRSDARRGARPKSHTVEVGQAEDAGAKDLQA